jgi:hypothetical protein
VGWRIYQSDYERLSDAVSGKRRLTTQEEQWAWNRLQVATHDPKNMKQTIADAWAKCMDS